MMFLTILALALCVVASALYSGSETAIYSLSRLRLKQEAASGDRYAARLRIMLRDEVGLLVTLLVGNNLMIELASHLGDHLAFPSGGERGGWWAWGLALSLPLGLFFFGELLPKDLFRRHSHGWSFLVAPYLAVSRWLYAPLVVPLRILIRGVERVSGLRSTEIAAERGLALSNIFDEGKASGAISAEMDDMLRNVLKLKHTTVDKVMRPWAEVLWLDGTRPSGLFAQVASSSHTRLPWCDREGQVRSYAHQIDVLAAGPDRSVEEHLHKLLCIAPDTPIDRALTQLRLAGARAALVGRPEAPVGLLTLKDLVEEISGDLDLW